MIRMVDDLEALPDHVDDPPARPQARGVAGGFRPGHDEARQLLPLHGRQLRRSARGWARAQTCPALPTMRTLPPPHRAPIDTKALGHNMHGDVTLEQIDRAQPDRKSVV